MVIYHIRVASLNMLERSLYFLELELVMTIICVLMEATCSQGLHLPSNFASECGLKISSTPPPPSNHVRGMLRIKNVFLPNGIYLMLALLEFKNVFLQSLIVVV